MYCLDYSTFPALSQMRTQETMAVETRTKDLSPVHSCRCKGKANQKGHLMKPYLWLFGVLLLAGGLYRGEERQVLSKAVRICLECIGIG